MPGEQPAYFSYLLRLWRVNEAGAHVLRASLEDPITGERRGFADLKSLFVYLEEQVGGTLDRQDRLSSRKSDRY